MRKLILVTTLLIVSFIIASAQEPRMSAAFEKVKASFKSMYPAAEVKEWELEKDNRYEVDFIMNNLKYEAEFAEDGTWLYTERDINLAEAPEPVLNSFKLSAYSSWKIKEIDEINSPEHERIYEIEIKKDNNKLYLYFSPEGELVHSGESSLY